MAGNVTVAARIARLLIAIRNCEELGNVDWWYRHKESVSRIVRDHLPSGSGVDCGTALDWDRSGPDRLVFNVDFHHMAESGMYDGWTRYTVRVRPSLAFGLTVTVFGSNRNGTRDYLAERYTDALSAESKEETSHDVP